MKYSKRKIVTVAIQLIGIVCFVAVDLIIKGIVIDKIPLGADVGFIKNILGFTYVRNTGVAWSMFDGNPQLLSVITACLIFAVLIYLVLPLKRPLAYDICIPFILAGGTANLIDRIMRGFVVDYIKTLFVNFPVYNFADCLITCGAAALVIYMIYEIVTDAKKNKAENTEEKQP